jgi:small subunit ribosomal protein S21
MKGKKTSTTTVVSNSAPPEMDWEHFSPLEVEVKGNFEKAFKMFRQMVQTDGVLALYKEKQSYEKPSVKKRRKSAEAQRRVVELESKMKKIRSGEYEKEKAKKLANKEKRAKERAASDESGSSNG